MGMGMLFAGALTGGANALGALADQAYKRQEDDRRHEQSLMARREDLLFEMKVKADMAREQERMDAEDYVGANERGRAIGDDRRFSKFREDVRSTGGGEGMSEDELRGVFNENYNDKVVAGSDRYYEPESADKRDALQAARSSGASGKVIAGLNEEYRGILGAERQAKQDADREAREDRRYREQAERDERLSRERDERDERRHQQSLERDRSKPASAGEVDQASKLSVLKDVLAKAEASKPSRKDYRNEKSYTEAMTAWGESDSGKMAKTAASRINQILEAKSDTGISSTENRAAGDVEALQKEIAAVNGGNDKPEVKQERLRILGYELEKAQSALAPKSAVKDNQTADSRQPVEVKSKAAYDALPKGARYVAPDGTVRTKG